MEKDVFDKIAFFLDELDRRVTAIEHNQAAITKAIGALNTTAGVHGQSLTNLADRMTHETLAVADMIDDTRAMVSPVYERVMPGLGPLQDELNRIVKHQRPL